MPRAEQLLLNLRPRPDARLGDFAGASYAGVMDAVGNLLRSPDSLLFIHGVAGSGRSHLLSAICTAREEGGGAAVLLPLQELREEDPGLLQGLEAQDLLACDDVEAIAGHAAWEEALFHLFNRVRAAGGRLVFASSRPPREAGFRLPDLASRLALAPCWELGLPDDGSRQALLARAIERREIDLDQDVLRYLALRGPRTPGGLMALVEGLDKGSLQAGRRLTIPFARKVLEALPANGREASSG
ncbi:MAG TPA: DnaA regulatory inactivator Hda [Moraxellaceae bacterium]